MGLNVCPFGCELGFVDPLSRDTTSHSTAAHILLHPRQIHMRTDSQSAATPVVARGTPQRLRCANTT